MSDNQYAPDVGVKFYADGRVRQFPGNTVICFAEPDSPAYQLAEWTQTEIGKQAYGHKFTMLPPSSFHMTVFELLCDDVRTADKWSSHLSLDAPLVKTDDYFMEAFAQVDVPQNFQMRFESLNLGTNGLSFYLQPIDDAMEQWIRGYRDALSQVTGVRQPNHTTYAFHLSLMYRIIQLTAEEEKQLEALAQEINHYVGERFGVFDTGAPVLTFFDDMFAFVPQDARHTLASRTP